MKLLLVGHGYVGSYLAQAADGEGHEVTVCDARPDALTNLTNLSNAISRRYQDLSEDEVGAADAILWFAGHSSVGQAERDPDGALANNCFDLLALARRKRPETRLIYASTASLYSVAHRADEGEPEPVREGRTLLNPVNAYDCSKIAFDALATCYAENLTGVRMGTVCGWAPMLRPELVFNAMNVAAITTGRVKVANSHAWRSILFLDDLAALVAALLHAPDRVPRIVNAASMSLTIGQLARIVARHHGAEIDVGPDTPTYSFRMDTAVAHALAGPVRPLSLGERCAEFTQDYLRNAR